MSIVIEALTKRYGTLLVVDRVSLEVADGELFVLLGGSGSGKSTILRMIAGLTPLDGGRILLHGRDVTRLPPQQRGTGFVFQNYSIFRHMSIAENVEFGLRIRGVPAAARAERREALLDMVGLAGLGARYADQLSGGQRQRVALARALAYEPSVLLLDEPFGALDVKIRAQLRRSLREIQQRLGVTTILVTHDQEEAFELGDRIGVMERGHLLEVGEPEALYRQPRSTFVATFLGAGTVLMGRVRDGAACFGPMRLPLPPDDPHEGGDAVQLLVRPEQVRLSDEPPLDGAPVLGRGVLVEQSFVGAHRKLRLRLPRLAATRQVAPAPPFGEEGLLVDTLLPSEARLTSDSWWVSLSGWQLLEPPPPRLVVYDRGEGATLPITVAARLAEAYAGTLTVLGVAERDEETHRKTLVQRARTAGVDGVTMRVRGGDVAAQLLAEQAESLADLLIVGAGTGRAPDPTLVTLLESAECPVLIVRGPDQPWRRVLICTAAGEPGKDDVRVGGRLARRLGADVTLLHVTPSEGSPFLLAPSHLERGAATLRALDLTVTPRTRPAATPAEGIVAEAEEGDCDLIVVGRHGPPSRSLFGLDDVTLQVLTRSTRSVLVVPMGV